MMDAQEELDRLAAALARALGTSRAVSEVAAEVHDHSRNLYALVCVGARFDAATVETRYHTEMEDAVSELRAILRADTDGAIADVLDGLASEAEHGPITAEMLRTMARARRGL